MSSTDELFASLGGSLMKDLWDDLQVGEGDDDGLGFSLEQLEKELAHLDDTHDYSSATNNVPMVPFSSPAFAPPPGVLSAASLVVSNQTPVVMSTPSSMTKSDAWQASLEKFTATSLELEFLAADSARKSTTTKPSHPPGFLDQAEEYNVKESIPAAPPGIVLPKTLVSPTPKGMPSTPTAAVSPNKSRALPEIAGQQTPARERKTPPPKQQQQGTQLQLTPPQQQQRSPVPAPYMQLQSPPMMQGVPPPHQAMIMMQGMPPHPGMMMHPHQGMPPPQGMMMMSPQHQGQHPQQQHHPMPMGIPVPQMMKPDVPWKSPVQPPPQQHLPVPVPPIRLYCHAHPGAEPIPASTIQSTTMTSRDLAYIVHSMLKPVLIAGSSPTDYNIQFLQRAAQNSTGSSGKTPIKKYASQKMTKEMASRNQKTMEWVKDKKALGAQTKTDVTRPRALLAVSSSSIKKSSTDDDEDEKSHKDRAALWKARLYIDSGQTAVSSLMQIWQTNTTTAGVPPAVQFHLKKLFKVLGITMVKNDDDNNNKNDGNVYELDETKDSLQVMLKLSKGKHFVARLLEHALLPPNAAQVLVPAALKYALASSSNISSNNINNTPSAAHHDGEEADARLFSSFTRVLTMLPQWSPTALLLCLDAATTKEALSSQPRMECLHTLLRRGNAILEPPEFVEAWKTRESTLMELFG